MSKCKTGYYYCYTDKKCKPISKGLKVTARFSGGGREPEEVGIDKPLNGNGSNGGNDSGGNNGGNGGSNGGNGGGMSEGKSHKDHEPEMIRNQLKTAGRASKRIEKHSRKKDNFKAWVQSKITKASDYLDTAADYLDSKDVKEGSLHKWFKGSKSKDGKGGWVNVVTGGTCASDEPGEGTPKCVSSAKRASMSKAERLSAQRRKKKADPGQQQKSGAAKPTYVSTDKKKMKKEEVEITEAKDKKGKGSGTKDACYHKVKSRYSVWPSAYASGALVKCRKVGAANWGNKSESVDYSNWRDDFKAMNYEFIDLIKPEPLTGEKINEGQKCWKGYEKKGTKKMFGKTYNNCVKKEETEIKEKKDPCWDTHKQVGMKKKNGRMVPNCVPKEEFSDWRSELDEAAAWTKKSGKNESGGLNEKGRKSYERENPGSDLKRPSKKVGNPRRKSFCARMKGMKKKLTSAKTANDPDSRINKSLRAWNC